MFNNTTNPQLPPSRNIMRNDDIQGAHVGSSIKTK